MDDFCEIFQDFASLSGNSVNECESLYKTILKTIKKEKLILLRDSAKQLFDICNDIVDFDKIEHGQIPIVSKNFDFSQLISDIVALNNAAAIAKNLDLKFLAFIVIDGIFYQISQSVH